MVRDDAPLRHPCVGSSGTATATPWYDSAFVSAHDRGTSDKGPATTRLSPRWFVTRPCWPSRIVLYFMFQQSQTKLQPPARYFPYFLRTKLGEGVSHDAFYRHTAHRATLDHSRPTLTKNLIIIRRGEQYHGSRTDPHYGPQSETVPYNRSRL